MNGDLELTFNQKSEEAEKVKESANEYFNSQYYLHNF